MVPSDSPLQAGLKKTSFDTAGQETQLQTQESLSALLEVPYSISRFDGKLIWSHSGKLLALPVAASLLCGLGTFVVLPLFRILYQGFPFWVSVNASFQLLASFFQTALVVLWMKHIRGRLEGRPGPRSLALWAEEHKWTLVQGLFLNGALLVIHRFLTALLVRWITPATAAYVFPIVGGLYLWIWLHVLSRLALQGNGAAQAFSWGVADSIRYVFGLPFDLVSYPGMLIRRFRGKEGGRASALDLLWVILALQGGMTLLYVLQHMILTVVYPHRSQALLYVVVNAVRMTGIGYFLALGLGRWSYYNLKLEMQKEELFRKQIAEQSE